MQYHGKAGEHYPDCITFVQVEITAAAGCNHGADFGGRRDPDDALGIDFAEERVARRGLAKRFFFHE